MLTASNAGAATPPPVPVAATVWPATSYFVRNDVATENLPAFIVADQAGFDAIFDYGATIGPSSVLDTAIFSTKTMLGIAEESRSICSSKLASVTRTGSTYTVRYTQTCPPPASAHFRVPFVVLVPKAPIAGVTFVKNGRVVARIKR
jgi:hypothetical protein